MHKSIHSSKPHHRHRSKKGKIRMEFGMSNLSIHRRRSKIHSTRKRDHKAQVKKEQELKNPEDIKASIEENFKKMKFHKTKIMKTTEMNHFVETPRNEGNFLVPKKIGMSNKRKMLLLNKENMQTC